MPERDVGCLLIGEERQGRIALLRDMLRRCGAAAVWTGCSDNLLHSVQIGLREARRPGGSCIAAEGEMWAAALALAAQMQVDRVVLIAPEDRVRNPKNNKEKQIGRLKSFARRNLFFCVSEVLILEETGDCDSARSMEHVCRGMCNARIHRVSLDDEKWINCKYSPIEAAARFLLAGEFAFSLA